MRHAAAVHESVQWVIRTLARRRAPAAYRLRENGRAILIRHRSLDPMTLDQVFVTDREYEPPPEAAAAVGRLGRPPRVVDVGANVGLFFLFALERFPGSSVLAYEPDPENAALARRCIELNGIGDEVSLIEACAATRDGEMAFAAGDSAASHAAGPGEPALRVAAVDAMPEIAAADFVKIDAEGAEWELLADPRLASAQAAAMIIEYHTRLCPDPDPRAYATRLLESAGFRTSNPWHNPEAGGDDGMGLLWAWRPQTVNPTARAT
ncbi:MAG: FkbM family methyltransferase [Thermoleophilaceae bacterium]